MAFVVKDRVRQISNTTGTGTLTLISAVTGFQTFSVIGNGNTTSYTIVDANAGTWEVGIGTYTAVGTTLSRDVVLESSNSGSLVDFGVGAKDVFVAYPAEKAVYLDTTNTFTANQVINVADNTNAALRITQTGTGNALLVEDSGNPDSTPFVIDSAGRVIVAGTTNVSSYGVQINNSNPIDMVRWDAISTGPTSRFAKSRSGVVGTYSAVASGDTLGTLAWSGDDGTSFVQAASILTAVDGTPGTNDMPGRLVFNTTADGVSTPTERMRITSDGRVAIGSTGNAGTTLALGKSITGSTTAVGTILNGVIQSDVTGAFHGYRSSPAIQAAAFTLADLNHFSALPQTYGVGSTVTNQYGFNVGSTLTGATNNYGFFGNIGAGTGRWNFYANGNASNFFGGNTIISVADNTNAALRITQTGTGNALLVEDSGNPDATPFVIDQNGTTIIGYTTSLGGSSLQVMGGDARYRFTTTPTNGAFANLFRSRGTTVGTNTSVQSGDQIGNINFLGADGTSYISAASILAEVDGTPGTNDMPGRLVFNTTSDGASTPTERMRIDNTGAVGIGTTSLAGYALRVSKTVTGGTTGIGVRSQATAASDVTSSLYGFYSDANTSAAAFTLSNLHHFRAVGTTPGAGSTITTQYGFHADSGLTGAATNYGFYSDIASGTGRWNFYANGTADNFFGGNTFVRGSVRTEAAATQDAVVLAGRAGGTSSYAVTFTPTTLSANRTVTLPDANINFATGLGVAQGGTGTTSLTANNVILGNGTSAVQFVAPGTSGNVLTSNGTTWISAAGGGGGSQTLTISNQTGAYTVVAGDLGKIINCTANSFTVSLTAAATLGSGFNCWIWNTSTTVADAITIDPNASETIDGRTTLVLRRGEGLQLVCDGTNWQTGDKKTMRGYAENVPANLPRPSATGSEAVALANESVASGQGSFATQGGTASSNYSTAIGRASNGAVSQAVTGSGAMALGGSYASGASSFAAAIANNTSTYGAQGANSVAIGQLTKATGVNAFSAGYIATASGISSTAIGEDLIASQKFSVAMGGNSSSTIYGKMAVASGKFATNGDAQTGKMVLRRVTSDATATVLTSDGSTPSTTNQVILPNDSTYAFTILVVARRTDADNESAGYEFKGVVDRNANAASTAIVGTVAKTVLAEDTAAWDVNVTADTTNGGLKIEVTGEAAKTIRWVATCWTSEVTG